MEEKLKLLIAADLVPTASNLEYFRKAELSELMGTELLDTLNAADARLFNVEAPITGSGRTIVKSGQNLKIDPSAIAGIKAMKPNLLALANNHIRDFANEGITDTINLLDSQEIGHIGAGENIDEARKTGIISVAGKTVAVTAFAEHEFSIAKTGRSGANPYDPLTSFDDVKAAVKNADYTVVLYHGGKEHYRYPTPEQRRICRKFIEAGADLVVCQHSHCIGAAEKYDDRWIVYGQGNFIFDICEDKCWQTSMLIEADLLSPGKEPRYVPVVKQKNRVRMADKTEADEIMSEFKARSDEIAKPGFVEEHFGKTSAAEGYFYLRRLHGAGILYKAADKLTKDFFTKTVYRNKDKLADLANCLECETHREAIINYLHSLLDL